MEVRCMLVGQGRTQNANSHPNGAMTELHGDLEPGGPVTFGAGIALTPIPPMTI